MLESEYLFRIFYTPQISGLISTTTRKDATSFWRKNYLRNDLLMPYESAEFFSTFDIP